MEDLLFGSKYCLKMGATQKEALENKNTFDFIYNVDAGSVQTSYSAHTVGRTSKVIRQKI